MTLVVGPNNAGKSAFLRDLTQKLQYKSHTGVVLHSVSFERKGLDAQFEAWVVKKARRAAGPSYVLFGQSLTRETLMGWWTNMGGGLQQLYGAFCQSLTTEHRLLAANAVALPPLAQTGPSHPLHELYLSLDLEHSFSRIFRRAFGTDLIVNRLGGSSVALHVGERPPLSGEETVVSDRYARLVEQLPLLQTQGDGIRSFVGVMLSAFAGDEDILIIDEPEAFLHPPQARLLGQMLAKQKPPHRQLFLATHSGDFLRGVISADSTNVRLARISRQGERNSICELSQQGVRELWSDPLLRQSNALDGVFHERVIACESDADCRFYSALMDAVWEGRKQENVPDVMFTHCGGKHRLPMLVRALTALQVPVRVVVDFDVLRDETPLREIVEAIGGSWADVKNDWYALRQAINQKKPELRSDEVKAKINEVLDNVVNTEFPDRASSQIKVILRQSSPWSIAKGSGKAYVPSGTPTQTLNRLLGRLQEFGVHVVEVGELESFDRKVGGHGPDWVNEVVQKDLVGDPDLQTAREFVSRLVG